MKNQPANPNSNSILLALASLALGACPVATAQESQNQTLQPTPETSDTTTVLDPVFVIGSQQAVIDLPGSGAFIDEETIRSRSETDVNKVLRRVPGVYVREEDGFGLFPNISLRGTDAGRSSKVTIMEDGILNAPAPYSAPSAYYFPNVARMSGVEVLKGSSSVRFGPHTTGGVINFLSTPVPDGRTFYLKTTYGTDNDITGHSYYGDVVETDAGTFGFLLEGYYRQNDGFRTTDQRPGFTSGDETGFTRIEPMFKMFYEPATDIYQRFEAKYGYSKLDADETYLGLAETDLGRSPYRRYAATRYDNIITEQHRSYLRHIIEPTDNIRFTTTGYYNEFARNWFKIRRIKNSTGANVGLATALASGGEPLSILKGNAAGGLDYRNNDRSYWARGIQEDVNISFDTGSVSHDLDFGIRYHEDQIRRFQTDELFTQDATGRITKHTVGPAGGGGNRRQKTEAIAVHLQDKIQIGNLSLTPGVRFEHLDFSTTEFDKTGANPNRATSSAESDIDVWAPGIGVNYEFSDLWSAFGGVHRGFSTPSPRGNASGNLDEETSLGYELGVRHNGDFVQAELVGFYTDFENIIVPDTVGASGGLSTDNLGNVNTAGIEFKISYDPAAQAGLGFNTPLAFAATYTSAELDGNVTSADAESIFSGGLDGNRLPYIPEFQFFASAGVEIDRFGFYADVSYTPDTFATASNNYTQVAPDGSPDARYGEVDSRFLVDLTASYQATDNIKLLGGIKNTFGEEYITSRLPDGPRSGAPRFCYIGVEIIF